MYGTRNRYPLTAEFRDIGSDLWINDVLLQGGSELLLELIGSQARDVHFADERKIKIAGAVDAPGLGQLLGLQYHNCDGVIGTDDVLAGVSGPGCR